MKAFLEYLLSQIVDHKDKVKVEERRFGENVNQYLISTDPSDVGKVIGKGGNIIQAIRNIAKILAIKEGKQIRIEIE
ncbi:KH domain-containing protein [Candidatus Gottesmanbacteria bacterium]|nr:KH domain-containing protein [Candidatus Gottesmanbacteria bacterium]